MIDGHTIFKLVDTHGLPLDIIVLELRDRNLYFNAAQFIESAVESGWKLRRIHNMMMASYSGPHSENLSILITTLYEKYQTSA